MPGCARIGTFVVVLCLGYWMYIQPTEFDEYVSGTTAFMDDLYSGNLLSDTSQNAKDNVDTIIPNIEGGKRER